MPRSITILLLLLSGFDAFTLVAAEPPKPFHIRVTDESTGRGVPLVELKTINNIRLYTDSAGNVAFAEPGLMDRSVFFFVESHGYEFPKDGFGFRGRALDVTPGGRAELKIRRVNIAERLYRTTGAGIYRDTLLVGEKPPIANPALNGQVLGCDSVMTAVYGGRLFWFWGDTSRPSYPLGNFHMTGATTKLPDQGLDPDVGFDFDYFLDDDGFARGMAPMEGPGPTWFSGLVVLRDGNRERMFAGYSKIRGMLDVYRRGIIEYDPKDEVFRHVADVPLDAPVAPMEHAILHRDDGVEYVYFCTPYPLTRVRATPEAYCDHRQYEAYTCLVEGSRLDNPKIDRDDAGAARYAWRKNTPAVGPDEQQKLIAAGVLKPEEALLQLRDVETGKPVVAHRGTVSWNEYRNRWVMIATQLGGKPSFLGEIWYAEADTLLGPWVDARKIVTHDKYTFYNPKHHPLFDQHGGRVIYFEGTYTTLFSGNEHPTPRYDYNQIMYRLDLSDPRLNLRAPGDDVSR